MSDWWKETVWLKPSWWHDNGRGNARSLVYTHHALDRAAQHGYPVFKALPVNARYYGVTIGKNEVSAAQFIARVEGRDLMFIVKVPLFSEYGVLLTVFKAMEGKSKRSRTSRMNAISHRERVRSRGERPAFDDAEIAI